MKIHNTTLKMTACAAALCPIASISDAEVITGVTIEDVSSELTGNFGRVASRTIDGSGFDSAEGFHSISAGDNNNTTMWLSAGTFDANQFPSDPLPGAFIVFDVEGNYDLNSIEVWNYNEFVTGQNISLTSRGARQVDISVASSVDGLFTPILTDFELNRAPGSNSVDFGQLIDLSVLPGTDNARLVRIDIDTNWDGDNNFAGLSEVVFDGTVIPEPGSLALLGLGGLLVARRRKA
ncbi:MAG: DUF4457 domain-containing protein [Planctomycetota bacterium]